MHVSRRHLPDHGLSFSRLAWGAWRLADSADVTGPADIRRLIDTCLELGITTIDHADIYGGYRCEALFGAALAEAPQLRSELELVSKCDIALVDPARPAHRIKHYDTSRDHILSSVDGSLRALRVDTLDLLLLHRPDPLMDADVVAAAFDTLHRAGKVRAFGVSNFLPHQAELLRSRVSVPLIANQIETSVLHLDALFDGSLDHAQQHRWMPMFWSPLGGAALFTGTDPHSIAVRETLTRIGGRYAVSDIGVVALAWLLSLPGAGQPILGTMKPDRLRILAEAEALAARLARQDWYEILEAAQGHEVP